MAARKYALHVCPTGYDAWKNYCACEAGEGEAVTAYDARDVDPLVEAVRGTLCDDTPCSRCDHLRAALAPFDNEES